MSNASHPDYLRIAGTGDPQAVRQWQRQKNAQDAIARENQSAAHNPALDPLDPRWVLAIRAYTQLQGSTLTPERRARVMKTAQHLGLRTFDANLIIAVVQDHARTGLPLEQATGTLSFIKKPASHSEGKRWIIVRWLLAIFAALLTSLWLMLWLLNT